MPINSNDNGNTNEINISLKNNHRISTFHKQTLSTITPNDTIKLLYRNNHIYTQKLIIILFELFIGRNTNPSAGYSVSFNDDALQFIRKYVNIADKSYKISEICEHILHEYDLFNDLSKLIILVIYAELNLNPRYESITNFIDLFIQNDPDELLKYIIKMGNQIPYHEISTDIIVYYYITEQLSIITVVTAIMDDTACNIVCSDNIDDELEASYLLMQRELLNNDNYTKNNKHCNRTVLFNAYDGSIIEYMHLNEINLNDVLLNEFIDDFIEESI